MNALWNVRYVDLKTGHRDHLMLCSPDLKNPRAAHKRARDTAKARLNRKGLKVTILGSECVG